MKLEELAWKIVLNAWGLELIDNCTLLFKII